MATLEQQDAYGEADRPELRIHVPAKARTVLDVGCGRGGFSADLRSVLGSGARLFGIEPVESARIDASRRPELEQVFAGFFPDDLPSDVPAFDLIVFNDILEHVFDPWSTLSAARRYLSKDGQVMASIPNVQHAKLVSNLVRGRWEYTDTGTLDRTHVRFFTKGSMVQLFHDAGFEVDSIVGINSMGASRRTDATGLVPSLQNAMVGAAQRALGDFAFLQFVIVARPR